MIEEDLERVHGVTGQHRDSYGQIEFLARMSAVGSDHSIEEKPRIKREPNQKDGQNPEDMISLPVSTSGEPL
jgi:hypothetical protein